MLVKLDHFPRDRGESKKYLSCHHLVMVLAACDSEAPSSSIHQLQISHL